jgi:hypothetical protein
LTKCIKSFESNTNNIDNKNDIKKSKSIDNKHKDIESRRALEAMLGSLIIKRTTPKALRTLRCENNTKGIDYQKAKNTKSYIRFIDKTQEFTGNTKTKSKDHLQCTKTTCRLDIYLHSPYFLMQNFASTGEKTYLSFARFLFCLKTFHQILREKSIKLPYLDLNSLACH